jgi:hypothetical protein
VYDDAAAESAGILHPALSSYQEQGPEQGQGQGLGGGVVPTYEIPMAMRCGNLEASWAMV